MDFIRHLWSTARAGVALLVGAVLVICHETSEPKDSDDIW
jgi:hypothetical protein